MTELTVLAFDTSGAHCAAALMFNGQVDTRVDEMARGQAEHLMPMLEEMLHARGRDWRGLDGVGVGIGPGNFTGIRISVSAARGVALGLGKPAVGISMLETTRHLAGWAQVAVPAPRGQFYAMDFDRQTAPAVATRDHLDGYAFSTEHSAADHAACLVRLVADRIASGETAPPPAPLYVRPADAAPALDTAPRLLDGPPE